MRPRLKLLGDEFLKNSGKSISRANFLVASSFIYKSDNAYSSKVRIPEYSATYSSDIRPPIPGYPATFDTLL